MEAKAERRCKWCGGPMPEGISPRALYCSKRCRNAYFRAAHRPEHDPCRNCGGPMPTDAHPRAEYCSAKCRAEGARAAKRARDAAKRDARRATPRYCKQCGGLMPEDAHPLAAYCSDACFKAHDRERCAVYREDHREERNARARAKGDKRRRERPVRLCDQCGGVIPKERGSAKRCSKECSDAAGDQWRAANAEHLRANYRKHVATHREDTRVSKRRYKNRRRAVAQGTSAIPYTRAQWRKRLALFGSGCWLCGEEADHADHIVPLSPREGEPQGADRVDNLAPLCGPCNIGKNNRPVPAWLPRRMARMLDIPTKQARAELDELVTAATGRPAAETWDLFYAEEPDYAAITEAVLMLAAVLGTRPAELAA